VKTNLGSELNEERQRIKAGQKIPHGEKDLLELQVQHVLADRIVLLHQSISKEETLLKLVTEAKVDGVLGQL
jgi:hypothetical protein